MPAEGAVVYGQGQAIANLPQNLNYLSQVQAQRQAQVDAEAQRMAQVWRDNELEAADGQLWANQLGEIEQRHVMDGQRLMQQGINPYESMNPKAVEYRRQRREIMDQRGYRKGIEDQYKAALTQIRNNPNKYNAKDIQALNDWVSNTRIGDAYRTNAQLPQLRERFDADKALTGLKATTTPLTTRVVGNQKIQSRSIDRPATEQAILGTLLSNPGGEEYLQEITGGLPVRDVLSTPDNLDDNIKFYESRYDGDPQFREQIAAQMGITSKSDPRLNQVFRQAAQTRLNAKRNFDMNMDRWVSMASSGVSTTDSVTPDYTQERMRLAWANHSLSKQREDRLRSEASGSDNKGTSYIGNSSVPVGIESQGTSALVPIRGSIGFDNTNVNMSGGDVYLLDTRSEQRSGSSIRGSLVNLGEYPFDSATGQLLDESQVPSSQNVEWRKMAHVRDEDYGDVLVPADKVPQTLSGPKKKVYDAFMSSAGERTQQSPTTGSQSQKTPEQIAEDLIRKYSQ